MKKSNLFLSLIGILRKIWANARIRSEKKEDKFLAPMSIGKTQKLEILPLYEARSEKGLKSGLGVSYLVHTDDQTILFDLGNNPDDFSPSPLEENMNSLGISIKEIDFIFVSHHHPDHIGGMKWWRKGSFSFSGTFQTDLGELVVYAPVKLNYPTGKIITQRQPVILGRGVASTGKFTFLESYPSLQITPSDSEHALAINVEGKGIVLIIGCGHMGLSALLNRSKYLFKEPIVGIVGGLHYGNFAEKDLSSDIQRIRDLSLQTLALSPHDSNSLALKIMETSFPDISVKICVGEPIQIV